MLLYLSSYRSYLHGYDVSRDYFWRIIYMKIISLVGKKEMLTNISSGYMMVSSLNDLKKKKIFMKNIV